MSLEYLRRLIKLTKICLSRVATTILKFKISRRFCASCFNVFFSSHSEECGVIYTRLILHHYSFLLWTVFVSFCDRLFCSLHCLTSKNHLTQVVFVLNFHDAVLDCRRENARRLLQIIERSASKHL